MLVDDLAWWLSVGRQPTGIPRVAAELLETAYRREDIETHPTVSILGTAGRVGLGVVDRDRFRWDPGNVAAPSWLLQTGRRIGSHTRAGALIRRAGKALYSRITDGSSATQALTTPPDVVVIPGAFWLGAAPDCARELARLGVPIRILAYDLFPLTHPEWFDDQSRELFRRGYDSVIPLADRIVSLGRVAAADVAARYPDAVGRIAIAIPTLTAHAPRRAVSPDPLVAKPYLLALGTVEPRKNHEVILQAWTAAKRRLDGTACLVVAGQRGWEAGSIEAQLAAGAEELNVVRITSVSDDDVERLYRHAAGTVHASWAEGFGLPVRESIARGLPTLVSSGIPRDGLVEGTYELFDPSDAAGLADLIVDVLSEPKRRHAVDPGNGTGWEPVLSALVD